jgi:uncharacterized membrane protein YbhN (UPF0104 family)
VPVRLLWTALRGVSPGLWLGTLALFLLGHVVAGLKWWLLTARTGHAPLGLFLRAHLAGLTANLCLPGVAGGDLVRAAWAIRAGGRWEGIGVACVTDRLLDCTALLILASLGTAWTAQGTGLSAYVLCGGFGLVALCGVAAGMAYRRFRRNPADGLAGRLAAALGGLIDRPLVVLAALLLSLLVQGGFIGLNAQIGAAAGVGAPAGAWLVAWPLAKLTALLPLSLGGLGVRESALVLFMRPFGAPAANVIVAGLLWQGIAVAGGLVGGVFLMAPRGPAPAPPERPAQL